METYTHNFSNFKIFYGEYQNGGGPFFCDFNHKLVSGLHGEKGLEICSGPGFLGYHLLYNKVIKELVLADKNFELEPYINQTNEYNKIEVPFYISDAFDNIPEDQFDIIISNPPHLQTEEQYKMLEDDGFVDKNWNEKHKEYSRFILLDEGLNFHKKFFNDAPKYLSEEGKIILYENADFITPQQLMDLGGNLYDYEVNRSIFKETETLADFYALICTKL